MKKYIPYLLLLALIPQAANAQQTIGTMVDGLFSGQHLNVIARLMEAIAYLSGIGLGMKGLFKLHEWSDSRGQRAKISSAIIYLACAGMLFGLPSMIQMGTQTFFNTNANATFNSSNQYGGQY